MTAQPSKSATVALVVQLEGAEKKLSAILSDEREIRYFESLVVSGEKEPLQRVFEQRERTIKEEEEFGDYVEELLCRPFLRSEVQQHALQWMKSKIRIEQYQRQEAEAAKIIAEYAYQLFRDDTSRTDMILKGPSAQVRVRIFVTPPVASSAVGSGAA